MERDEKRNYLVSLRESTGMTRKDFAIEYEIPYPTITDWELGHRRVPEYFLKLLAYRIEIEKETSNVQEKPSSDKTNLKVSQIDENNLTDDIVDKLLFTKKEVNYTLRLDDSSNKRLLAYCEAFGMTISEAIREAIDKMEVRDEVADENIDISEEQTVVVFRDGDLILDVPVNYDSETV